MDKIFTIAEVIVPIFVAIFLGALARRKAIMTPEEIQGLQKFVMNFGLPCVIFNSCLTANVGAESVSTMLMVIPFMLISTLWSFRARNKQFPYHNLPQLFCAQETGMLGIPLFMILFGTAQAYRMGILDLTQAVTAYPTIAILSAASGDNPTAGQIVKKVLRTPLLLMSAAGLTLNLTGLGSWLDSIGIGAILTESTGFLAQPISAMMIFSVGYNFSMSSGNRKDILKISAIHFVLFLLIGLIVQLGLFLIPNVDALTRWSVLLFSTLPASYLAPSLGKSETDFQVASGVCSLLTVSSLLIFCVIAAIVA